MFSNLSRPCIVGFRLTVGTCIAVLVALISACSIKKAEAPIDTTGHMAVPIAQPIQPPLGSTTQGSTALTPRDYRRDAATHLYALNKERIFAGKMPPLLYAVGVLQVEIDSRGQVTSTNWMRAPSHAPEVMVEIERSVRKAAPYPAPIKMGSVTYTDTWLWEKSGRFQLDTLTEGQL
jgi:protein TonB